MEIGFCVIIDSDDLKKIDDILIDSGFSYSNIGYVVYDKTRSIYITQHNVVIS